MFEKWFKAQFGKSPSDCRPLKKVYEELQNAKELVLSLETEIREIEITAERFRVASYTRNSAEKGWKF